MAHEHAAVRIFRGIPYAAPPVGPLRWRPPQPAPLWNGPRDASDFGADPIQLDEPGRDSRAPGMSEDCLTLNVWAPREPPPGGAPVLVWFDGGGFTACSAAKAQTDGTRFAQAGAVLVTANYRVGAFGFLAHPALSAESPHGASGNYGLLDAIAALRWVRENVAAFGGDPARITAFGESAGAALVALLMTSPLAAGAFDRAILQSPGSFRPLCTLAEAEAAGAIAGSSLADLRALAPAAVLALNGKIGPAVRGLTIGRPLRPIVDGWSIVEDEARAFRSGTVAAVPAIVGTNADEGRYFAAGIPVADRAALRRYLEANFGADADEAWTHYGCDDAAGAAAGAGAAFADAQFNYGARGLAREIARRCGRTYRYVFTHDPAGTPGPTHTDEIAYVFGTGAFGPHERAISGALLAAWVRFAACGDPNGPGLDGWAPYDPARDNDLRIGVPPAAGTGWRRAPLDFIERFYAARGL
jgi:para-nitrobenzyl esterase